MVSGPPGTSALARRSATKASAPLPFRLIVNVDENRRVQNPARIFSTEQMLATLMKLWTPSSSFTLQSIRTRRLPVCHRWAHRQAAKLQIEHRSNFGVPKLCSRIAVLPVLTCLAQQRTNNLRVTNRASKNESLFLRHPYSHASVTQIDSSVRPMGGAFSPAAVINLRISSPVSGCGIADCTPTRTRPSA